MRLFIHRNFEERLIRLLCLSLGTVLLVSCAALVPPWALRALWLEVDMSERTGLVILLSLIAFGVAALATWEARRG